jgi:serine/threonine-protein kinase
MSNLRTCPKGHQYSTDPNAGGALQDTPCPVCSSSGPLIPPPTGLPILPPPHVEGFEVLGELGRGGMGIVYKARQLELDRVVALKMILNSALAGPADVARFRTEARAAAGLQHPNIVQVYTIGENAGLPFFALEYVEGRTLAHRIAGAPQPPLDSARLVETLARAVHFAHGRHVVHRDLKPANVLLAADGTPKVADFGLA